MFRDAFMMIADKLKKKGFSALMSCCRCNWPREKIKYKIYWCQQLK